MRTKFVIGFIFAIGSLSLQANPQGAPRGNSGWLNVGVGSAGGQSFGGFSYNLSLNYNRGNTLFSGRHLTVANPLMVEIKKGASHTEKFRELSLLAGFVKKNRWWFGSISTGIGLIKGWEKIGLDYVVSARDDFLVLSIPIESTLLFTPVPILGLGVSLSGSINKKASLGGMHISMKLGI